MNTRIGIGVIGLGPRGRRHAQAHQEAAAGLAEPRPRLVSASDASCDACLEAVVSLGFRRSTPEYREVLDDPDVDVVSICAPASLLPEVALAAVVAGKHVWVDGPIDGPAEQWHRIARIAEQAGLVAGVVGADDTIGAEEARRFLCSVVTGERLVPSLAESLLPDRSPAYANL